MKRLPAALVIAGTLSLAACAPDPVAPLGEDTRPSLSHTGGSTIVVTEADVTRQVEDTPPTDNWVLYTRVGTPPTAGQFTVGPGDPPLGSGSFSMRLAASTEKVQLFNYDHMGTPLASITEISYATYKDPASSFPLPAINIQIDKNGGALVAGDFSTLVFEPYHQPGFVDVSGVWQTWDAINGGNGQWWSTGPLATNPCPQSNPCSWNELVAAYPGATIVGGFGINAGSGNAGLIGSADALSITYGGTSVTYDFEEYRVATNKDACKNGGWQNVRRADGSRFKNQGDCVSYVNTGR